MKEIKMMEELNALTGIRPSLVKFGQPNCIPCKMTQENLEEIENSKKYDLDFYECSNIDIITQLGYNAVPVVMLITSHIKAELLDSSIAMDLDELDEWIGSSLKII